MEIFFFIIFIPLIAWLIISPVVLVWWFFDPYTRDRFFKSHGKIAMVIEIGAFFSLMLIFSQGIEKLLSFIPDDWGVYDEDGEFVTTRSLIAYAIALLASFFFCYVLNQCEILRAENHRLNIIAEVERRKRELRYSCLDSLIEKRKEVETKLKDLREKLHKTRYSYYVKSEIQILEEMMDELEYIISESEQHDELEQ